MTKRHPSASRRPGQGKPADSDDAFVAGVLEFSQWAKKNQKILVIFAVAVVAVVLVSISYAGQRQRQLDRAGEELENIQATMLIGDPDAAKVQLSQYLEQFGNTPYAGEAALVLAQLYLETDQAELALRALERAGLGPRDPLRAQAETLRARALEMNGDAAQAEEIYLEVAEDAVMSFERTAARTEAARLRETRGDWAGAAELYRTILDGMELADPERGRIEMRLAEAETHGGG